jgi:hypothetical protein
MDPERRRRKPRSVKAHGVKPHHGAPKTLDSGAARRGGRVVTLALTPERMLERATRKFLDQPTNSCVKCGSTFIVREPAFIHCHYCGAMSRIANASLAAQELFELRLGLRLAS